MNNIEELLSAEYDSLQEKMYQCKTIHIRYKMKEEHKNFLLRQSILSIYAEWEGFIKKTIALYLQEVNKQNLRYDQLHENYISYQTDQIIHFKSPKTNFQSIKKLTSNLYGMYQKSVVFSTQIDTGSNANLKVVNSILEKLRIGCLEQKYEKELNKLLRFRNSIAHGDEGIPVTQRDVDSFSLVIQELASNLIVLTIASFHEKVFLQ